MPVDRTLSSTDRVAQERTLMDDYMRGTGQDPQVVRARSDDAARMLMMSAAAFAASRLRYTERVIKPSTMRGSGL